MKIYGNVDLNQGQIVSALFEQVDSFPTSPIPGQVVFKEKRVYVCTETQGTPTWIPLTNEMDIQVHAQSPASSLWEIAYPQSNTNCLVQVFDGNGKAIIPEDIDSTTPNVLKIYFNQETVGKAVIIHQANGEAAQSQGGVQIIGSDGKINPALLPASSGSGSISTTDQQKLDALTLTDIAKLASLSGTNTGDQTSVTGNAGTATKLATARDISVSGAVSGSASFDGSVDISIATALSPFSLPYDLAGSVFGLPTASEAVLRFRAGRQFSMPAGQANAQAVAGVAATASATFTIAKNGAQIGTVVFSAGGTVGAVTFTNTVSVSVGDLITLTAPASADATLADVDFTLVAYA
jgi:hypothetical protein